MAMSDAVPTTSGRRPRRSRIGVYLWELRYRIGPNLWVVPFSMAAGTGVLFAVSRQLDAVFTPSTTGWSASIPEWLLVRSPADAFVVLSAFLGALATTLALVFSISVLTFSLAAAQMGPRLIRRFMLDPVTQITLGAFLSAILLCSLTLGSVSTDKSAVSVPEVSYALSVTMSLSCFFLLIVYVHRVASTIQTPHVVASVVGDLDRTLDEAHNYLPTVARSTDVDELEMLRERLAGSGGVIPAENSGYVQAIDHLRLIDVADSLNAVVVMERRVGQFVVQGRPLAWVDPPQAVAAITKTLHESCEIGDARTRNQDIEFALNQVVEIGLRALSPAINDTFTGRTCVDWLGATLSRMAAEKDPTGGYCGADGQLRLVESPLRFCRMLRNAFDLLRESGANNPAITVRLFDALCAITHSAMPSNLPAIREYIEAVHESALSVPLSTLDVADINDRYNKALAAVARREAEVGR